MLCLERRYENSMVKSKRFRFFFSDFLQNRLDRLFQRRLAIDFHVGEGARGLDMEFVHGIDEMIELPNNVLPRVSALGRVALQASAQAEFAVG